MKVSELILKLQKILEVDGDLNVVTPTPVMGGETIDKAPIFEVDGPLLLVTPENDIGNCSCGVFNCCGDEDLVDLEDEDKLPELTEEEE